MNNNFVRKFSYFLQLVEN